MNGKIAVSACLLGENCKYNGGNNYSGAVAEFCKGKEVIPVCPEVLAGLGTPRTPMEIVSGRVTTRTGEDRHEPMCKAVAQLVEQLKNEKIDCAVLQSRSPSCGVREVYDGSFTGKKIPGSGVFAQALQEAGIKVIDAEELSYEV